MKANGGRPASQSNHTEICVEEREREIDKERKRRLKGVQTVVI